MIASFDVFDTLLTRRVGSPNAVFLLLGKTLLKKGTIDCTAQEFAYSRQEAQNLSLSKAEGKDFSLAQIYNELSLSLHLNEEQAQFILSEELAMEGLLLIPVPGALERVEREETAGKEIIYISDMYLPSYFIKEQLKKYRFPSAERIYVSNEYAKTKSSGALFNHIATELKLGPEKFFHFGDHAKSDFEVPIRLKWNAQHYKEIRPNRYEKLLNDRTWQTDGMSAAMAGASRYSRLSTKVTNSHERYIRDISAGVVGPVFTGFILWLLRKSVESNIKTLYFLARDGQIYHKMAEVLVRKLNLDLKLKYLYASRKAWRFAALTSIEEEDFKSWILVKKGNFTVSQVFKRVNLIARDFDAILKAHGFPEENWNNKLLASQIPLLKNVLKTDEVNRAILAKAKEQRAYLLQYLKQEGLTDGDTYAIVDIGWTGTSQDNLAKILQHVNMPAPAGYYFALKDKGFHTDVYGKKEGFIIDQSLKTGYVVDFIGLGSLIESFCHADHGSLSYYNIVDNRVTPVLEHEKNERVIKWGLHLSQETLCSFCEHLFVDQKLINPYKNLVVLVMMVMKNFGRKPNYNEASTWGSLMFECNQEETKWSKLSKPYALKEVIQALKYGRLYSDSFQWAEGCLVLTPKWTQYTLRIAAKTGRLIRRSLGMTVSKDEAGVI